MKAYLSIGANLDDREGNIEKALERIEESAGRILKESSVYETEPWGFQTDDLFLNIAVEIETDLNPAELLNTLKNIETRMGRTREDVSYSSRIIDIDILIYGNSTVNENNLKVPHPLMQERNFVLVPLNEISPDLKHPVLGRTISELLQVCSDTNEVRLISPPVHYPRTSVLGSQDVE